MSFIKFLSSKLFIINAIIAIAVLIVLYFSLILGLNSYTHHNEKITIPDFTNLTFKDAQELALSHHLKVKIVDTTYSEETERGLIAAQIPEMEAIVKENRTIYLTINSVNAEMINMPNFIGTSLRQATVDATIYGLNIGELSYVPDIARNNVLEQKINGKNIAPGTKIEKGTYVDLVLGMGLSNEKVFIPLLISKTLLEADSMLRTKYLNSGASFYDGTVATAQDSLNAIIYKQQPEPFSKNFKPGDFVDLWFTTDSNKIFIKQAWRDSMNVKIDTITPTPAN